MWKYIQDHQTFHAFSCVKLSACIDPLLWTMNRNKLQTDFQSILEFWNIDFHFFTLLSQSLISFYHSIDVNASLVHIFNVFCLQFIVSSRSFFIESLTCFNWVFMSSVDVAVIAQCFDVVWIACKSMISCFIDDVACVNWCLFCCFSTMLTNISVSLLCNQFRKLNVFIIQFFFADSLLIFSHKKRKRQINSVSSTLYNSENILCQYHNIFFLFKTKSFWKKLTFFVSASFIVYDNIARLVLIHRMMKNIVQNTHIKYNAHHKHHLNQSSIGSIVYDIKYCCLSFSSSLENNLSIHFLNFSFFASSSLFCWSTTECLCRNISYLFFNLWKS